MAAESETAWHPLRTLLHVQNVSDAKAVENLKYTLAVLSKEALAPSSHLQKWTARLASLMHASEPSAKWAGLCLALKTAQLSKAIMVECALSWVAIALPILSHNEPAAVLKASARFLAHIFSQAVDLQEFQRQIAIPNVPKFTAALLQQLKKNSPETSTVFSQILAHIIPLYPTLVRANHAALSEFCTSVLWGTTGPCSPESLVKSVSSLYAVLHFTGGKAGAGNLWRKSFDELLALASGSLQAMRTHAIRATHASVEHAGVLPVSACLEQLRHAVSAISALLRSNPPRPVPVPVANLCNLIVAMLNCTSTTQAYVSDPIRQTEELAAVPTIIALASELVIASSQSLESFLVPYRNQLLVYISYHLEQLASPTTRLSLLDAAMSVLSCGPPTHDSQVLARLAKTALPPISGVASQAPRQEESALAAQSRKGKKRVRAYEGEEVLGAAAGALCAGARDGAVLERAVQLLARVLQAPDVPAAVQSLGARVLLAAHLALAHIAPAALCPDLGLHARVARAVQDACLALAAGGTGVMSRSTGLVLGAMSFGAAGDGSHEVDLLLHPRLPPLPRPMPHVEHLSLFAAEESQEEAEARQELLPAVTAVAPVDATTPTTATVATPAQVVRPPAASTVNQPIPAVPSSSILPVAHGAQPTAQPVSIQPQALPPPPDPLPSSSAALQHETLPVAEDDVLMDAGRPESSEAPATQAIPLPMSEVMADDNDELPDIDLDSDSDAD